MARPYADWTDTDDAVVLAFPPAEAAAILGRSIGSIYYRRSLKDLGGAHGDRKPRRRLRRDYFRDGAGERDESINPRPIVLCRICQRDAHAHGLCKSCYCRVRYLVRAGYVSRAEVARYWPWAVTAR